MANVPRLWLGSPTVMEFDPVTGAYYLIVKVDGGIADVSITGSVTVAQSDHTLLNANVWIQSGSVVLWPGENHIGEVGGSTAFVTGSFTRPAATGTYDANDGVTDSASTPSSFQFQNIARVDSGSFLIVSARMVKSHTNTTNATFRLWLYKSTPSNIPNDGAAFQIAWAERTNRFAYIDFDTAIAGSNCVSYYGSFPDSKSTIPCKLPADTSINGILQVKGAYAPGASEQFFFELGVLQD